MSDRCADASLKQEKQVEMAMQAEDTLDETGLQKRPVSATTPTENILQTPKPLSKSDVSGPYASTTNHEWKIIKHTVLLLLANHKMTFRELLPTLTRLMPECKDGLSSEENLLAILEKYDIFEREKTGVCLKAKTSEGYITKIDGKYGFIDKATDKQGAVFHQSAVYIPPQGNAANELDYQLKVKSHVKYVSVSDSLMPSYFFPARRAVLVWLAGELNTIQLLAQVESAVTQANPVTEGVTSPTSAKCHGKQKDSTKNNEVPACTQSSVTQDLVMKERGKSEFGSEMCSDWLTTQITEMENITDEMNPTHDIMTMVFLFMAMLTQKVICIPRLVLASCPGVPTFVTKIMTDATLCRAFTSRHSTFLKLDNDDLSFLNMPSKKEEWSVKDAKVTRVWPNSATAKSDDGQIYIHRHSFFFCGSSSSDQGSQVPKRKLTSVLELKDKVTCLTVPYQVTTTVLPGAESSRYQTILAWHSRYLNQTLCCLLSSLSPKSMDISQKPASPAVSQDSSDKSSESAKQPKLNITEEPPVSLQYSTVKKQDETELEKYGDEMPTGAGQKKGNPIPTSGEMGHPMTTMDLAMGYPMSTTKTDEEMEHLMPTSKDKEGKGDLISTSEGDQQEKHSISPSHECFLDTAPCTQQTNCPSKSDSVNESLDFTEADDSSSLVTCYSDFDNPLLQLDDRENSLPASDPEEVTFSNGEQEVTQKFTGRLRKIDTVSKRNGNGHLEKASGHHETKEVGQDNPVTNGGLRNEEYLGKALLEVYNLLKCIEGHVQPTTRTTHDKGCQAGVPKVEKESVSCQTACVTKESSGCQTVSTGHIVISEYFTE